MSESTPGATEIADAPLPTDRAAAEAMYTELTGNAEWMKDWRTDQGKWSTLGYLRWTAAGNDPARWGRPPETTGDVRAQESDRAVRAAEEHAQVLDRNYDLTPRQRFEVLGRRPVYEHEKTQAANEFEKCMRDAARSWNVGGMAIALRGQRCTF
jgi:hypothetical protein